MFKVEYILLSIMFHDSKISPLDVFFLFFFYEEFRLWFFCTFFNDFPFFLLFSTKTLSSSFRSGWSILSCWMFQRLFKLWKFEIFFAKRLKTCQKIARVLKHYRLNKGGHEGNFFCRFFSELLNYWITYLPSNSYRYRKWYLLGKYCITWFTCTKKLTNKFHLSAIVLLTFVILNTSHHFYYILPPGTMYDSYHELSTYQRRYHSNWNGSNLGT